MSFIGIGHRRVLKFGSAIEVSVPVIDVNDEGIFLF